MPGRAPTYPPERAIVAMRVARPGGERFMLHTAATSGEAYRTIRLRAVFEGRWMCRDLDSM